jgi:uncharacterized membrane protein
MRLDLRVLTGGVVVLSGVAVAFELVHAWWTGKETYAFMLWNLFLAWTPFLLALAAYELARRGAARSVLAVVGVCWLLFFPNAPYMLTDFVHLDTPSGAPLWFDASMVAGFAIAGLGLGFASLYLVHVIATGFVGARRSWALVVAGLALASFGVYLGRFEQWNSWDLLVRPEQLLAGTARRLSEPPHGAHALVGTASLALLLSAVYAVLYELFDRRPRQRARSR